MSYTIYKTNGLQLLTLLDGTLNDKYGIKLVGKNYINYGTAQNENFVYLQENFANDTAPTYPLTGQLWYNTQSNTVSFFDGVTFNALANVSQLGSGIGILNTALVANVAILQTAIKANAAIQTANAGVQSDAIASLLANAGVQSDAIDTINTNVTAANVNISTLQTTAATLTTKTDSTNSNVAAVTHRYDKKSKTVYFSADTSYELFNVFGQVVKRGRGTSIECTALTRGEYWVSYDNQTEKFMKK